MQKVLSIDKANKEVTIEGGATMDKFVKKFTKLVLHWQT
jgi:hypothetical protein